jgi:hypothetical protein
LQAGLARLAGRHHDDLFIQREIDGEFLFDCQQGSEAEAGEGNAGDFVPDESRTGRNGKDDRPPMDWNCRKECIDSMHEYFREQYSIANFRPFPAKKFAQFAQPLFP